MRLKVIQSGSKGNCYLLIGESQTLIIEMGVRFTEVQKALHYDLSKVVGCLVSHRHQDHSKGIDEALRMGIKVYCGSDIEIEHHNLNKTLIHAQTFSIGEFKIMPFSLKHDVPCYGFLINHIESGNIVFITDTIYSPYRFENISNWIIEANYCEDILREKRKLSNTNMFVNNRVIRSHMSLQTCIKTLGLHNLKKANNIVLIHLSDSNSNAEQFKEKVSKLSDSKVHIATNDLEIEFNETSF